MDSTFNIHDSKTSVPPLLGLVLAGGRSLRMKVDKATLQYHDRMQSEHCFELLSPFCRKVYLSNRKEQELDAGHEGLPQIHDLFPGSGPLNGILSAMKTHPNVSWLVLACDMPFVDSRLIRELVAWRDPLKQATAFVAADGRPEPLCAIYEPSMTSLLLSCIQDDYHSPRFALMKANMMLIRPDRPSSLTNINVLPELIEASAGAERK
jgi:molybdopterin-guanine dinucleotide biosynthesis protein A